MPEPSRSADRVAPGADHRPQALSDAGQRVFHALSLGLVVFDGQLQIVHHNPAAAFLVREHASIADALASGTVDAQYQDWHRELREVIETGQEHRFDQVVFRQEAPGERLLNLLCIPLPDETGGRITGGTLVVEDATDAASLEKRLAVSERMAAVGKLAARVAHELNNPLDGILRYLNLALRGMESGRSDKVPDYLNEARAGLIRMSEIVRQLVEFSRSTHGAFDGAGITAVIEEAVKVMSDKATANDVSVVCTLNDDVPAAGATNLFQVFCNLVKNAIDAMPDGGTLTIRTEIAEGHFVVCVEDTGIGLPDNVERIFEPFFTTKEPGKGTGLGLGICRDIIEKYNGNIIPQRREGGGSVFVIRIPLRDNRTIGATASSSLSPAPARSRFTSPRQEDSA